MSKIDEAYRVFACSACGWGGEMAQPPEATRTTCPRCGRIASVVALRT